MILGWAVVPLIVLGPFANRSYHIHDALYLWSAKQIIQEPFDYYGTIVNKWGRDQPLSEVTVIPARHSYLLALVGLLSGWGEVPMRLALALFGSAFAVGAYLLDHRICRRRDLATALATPSFAISGVTVMTDVPMVTFFVWGVYYRGTGNRQDRHPFLRRPPRASPGDQNAFVRTRQPCSGDGDPEHRIRRSRR
jgi:hypothetical protein